MSAQPLPKSSLAGPLARWLVAFALAAGVSTSGCGDPASTAVQDTAAVGSDGQTNDSVLAQTDVAVQTDVAAQPDDGAQTDATAPTDDAAQTDDVAQSDAADQTDVAAQTDDVAQSDITAQTDATPQTDAAAADADQAAEDVPPDTADPTDAADTAVGVDAPDDDVDNDIADTTAATDTVAVTDIGTATDTDDGSDSLAQDVLAADGGVDASESADAGPTCTADTDCLGLGTVCSPWTCQSGQCLPGPALACQDNEVCTDDYCLANLGCLHLPNAATCTDGNVCSVGDSCGAAVCKAGLALVCDDGLTCTTDSCHPQDGCQVHDRIGVCEDGDLCTAVDTCSGNQCLAGPLVTCDDGNPCTTDGCLPAVGCVFLVAAQACSDGNACTLGDVCHQGNCQAGDLVVCNDDNPCATSACSPDVGCVSLPKSATCTDGSACTQPDTCKAGQCAAGSAIVCEDGDPCTLDACDPVAGCTVVPSDAPCDDGNACTVGDTCLNGGCSSGDPVDCDDGNSCTAEGCFAQTGCLTLPLSGPCSDNNECTIGDLCKNQVCTAGPGSLFCADNNACTDDACLPAYGCVFLTNKAPCNDGNGCTSNELCTNGACQAPPGDGCDDGNPCTEDYCTFGYQCQHYLDLNAPCGDDGSGICLSSGCCQPNCEGKQCGSDGCGGQCGDCPTEAVCSFGQCDASACGGLTSKGCCNGNEVLFCIANEPGAVQCGNTGCGWSNSGQYYDCGLDDPDPSGQYPYLCGATCLPNTVACSPTDANVAIVCDNLGNSKEIACPGCQKGDLQVICPQDVETQQITLNVQYKARQPNATLSGWSANYSTFPLPGAAVVVERQIAGGAVAIAEATLDAAGSATLQVPATIQPGDEITVILGSLRNAGEQLRYAVVSPNLQAGEASVYDVEGQSGALYAWTIPAADWAETVNIVLAADDASGAAHAFAYLHRMFEAGAAIYGHDGNSVALWMQANVSWDCGACFWDEVQSWVSRGKADTQIWLSWTALDEAIWSDAVIAHEVGHWWMQSFGTSPGEGGVHYIGVPASPGLAWSEGWASWVSAAFRQSPLYFDKQGGSSFWIDIDAAKYYDGGSLVPYVGPGLLQNIDEFLVSAILWRLTDIGPQGPLPTDPALAAQWQALASPRLNVPPYARGYKVQGTWGGGASAPMLADYLDALRCGGMAANQVSQALMSYPFPVNQPLCTVGNGL